MLAYSYDKPYLGNAQDTKSNEHLSSHLDESQLSDDDDGSGHKKIGKWTPEEDELLRKYAPMYDEKQWRKISSHIPGRSSIQCLHRWTKILKPGLVKGPWTAEEDQKLIAWVKAEGPTKWAQAANFIKGRSGKQCRERWFNNLSPNVKKGNWGKSEDELIFDLYQKYGTSWSKIAKYLPGRTENAIKNRFYSTLRKLAADKRKIKNEAQGTESQKSETYEDGKNSVTQTPISTALGASTRLYKLLQDTSFVEEQEENKRVPLDDDDNKENESLHDNGEYNNDNAQTKATQQQEGKTKAKNINKKENETTEHTTHTQHTVNHAIKHLRAEFEDNDLVFEKFLMALDDTTGEDFILKEIQNQGFGEDIAHYENLQQKILSHCQENIHGLAEAFKNIANNSIDLSLQEKNINQLKAKTVSQLHAPLRQPSGPVVSKIVPGNEGFYQNNIKGIKISVPAPVTQIGFNKRENIIMPTTIKDSFNNYATKNEDGHGQGYLMMPGTPSSNFPLHTDAFEAFGHFPGMGGLYSGHDEPHSQSADPKLSFKNEDKDQLKGLNSLIIKTHEAGTKNNVEGEKRMTFLFQQLHSLENLLMNTRNELMKLESTLDKEEKEKRKLEADESIVGDEVFMGLNKESFGPLLGIPNETVEQIVKKRKRA